MWWFLLFWPACHFHWCFASVFYQVRLRHISRLWYWWLRQCCYQPPPMLSVLMPWGNCTPPPTCSDSLQTISSRSFENSFRLLLWRGQRTCSSKSSGRGRCRVQWMSGRTGLSTSQRSWRHCYSQTPSLLIPHWDLRRGILKHPPVWSTCTRACSLRPFHTPLSSPPSSASLWGSIWRLSKIDGIRCPDT